MFDNYFSLVFDKSREYRWVIVGLTGILILGSLIGLRFISFENDIGVMLPGNETVLRSIRFLRESDFSDKVILSLELHPRPGTSQEDTHNIRDLINAADNLAESLKPPLVTDVVYSVAGTDMMEEMHNFLKYAPQLIDEAAISRIGARITPENVKKTLRQNYRQLLTPASAFTTPFIRSDPLGIKSGLLQSLQKLSASLGYEVTIENGHLISRDGKHALLILDTPVPLTDGFGSRELIAYLRHQLNFLPPFVSADIIAGHLHTVSNEDVIKRDIRRTMTIAGAGFIVLFLFFFRDIRAVFIFLMPTAAVLISVNLSALIFRTPSYFVVGMGVVIAGIAVDYGIHVYIAVRTRGTDAVIYIVKPVIISALTTMSVFAAFFFSEVRGYHQLASFALLSILLCLVCALFVLPHFSGRGNPEFGAASRVSGFRFPVPDSLLLICWTVLLLIAIIFSFQITFSSDVKRFDGSNPKIIRAEQRFYQVWGGENSPAIFVVPGNTIEEALSVNEKVFRDAAVKIGKNNFSSLASIWPSEETRSANAARWKKFWEQGNEDEFRKLLEEHGKALNFSEDAFSPFFDQLYEGTIIGEEPDSSFFSRIKERFVQEKQDGCQVLSFFPDTDEYVTKMEEVSGRYPGTFILSQNALSHAISRSVSSEIFFLSGIAALLIPALTWLLLRNLGLAMLALVPVITALVAVLGIIPAARLSLDAPGLFAVMVVVGLCIDYGIFMVYDCLRAVSTGTRMAVSLSAVSTLIGAGVLLLADHPVLFSVGITMVTGVFSGYIASVLVVPALYRCFRI
ncbi:hypothetical protein QUF80_18840 [Desulfococcaceae bacterium HSG8]|nr:hypothetical protein [Desulfococcaceae bacterium HSG8]